MTLTYKFIVARALMVGLAVGVLLAGYATIVVEPVVDRAIELEEQMAAAQADHANAEQDQAGHSHDEEEALFSRGQQKVGGAAAMLLYAGILGILFGTVYAAVRHRIPAPGEFGRTVRLAATGFVAVAMLPALKYPATPPAVGNADTVGQRTVQYIAMIVVGLVIAWLMARLSRELRSRLADPARIIVVTAISVVAVAVAFILLPGTPDAIDPAVPAGLVWDFRVRSLGGLALLWAGLGLGLGWVLDRAMTPAGSESGTKTTARTS